MDENNVHTSVVIELANQIDTNVQKMYQIDLNEMNSPKDYVIDQIFCGENVTVYALFEVEDEDIINEKESDNEMEEITTSSDVNNGVKSYRKKPNKIEACLSELQRISKENETDLSTKEMSKKRSFYCLEKYLDDSSLDNDRSDMKVLYMKEAMLKSPKIEKNSEKPIKTRSTGMNTDLAFCPKLLDEVREVINASFSGLKKEEKEVADKSVGGDVEPSKLSNSFIRFHESSCASSVNFSKRSAINFLLVPLVMTEEGLLKHLQREDQKSLKTRTNTEEVDGKDEQKIEFKNTEIQKVKIDGDTVEEPNVETATKRICTCKRATEESEKESLRNAAGDGERKDDLWRQSISDEIKSVQWKLNVIMKWLERDDLTSPKVESNLSEEELRKCPDKNSEELFARNRNEYSETNGSFAGEPSPKAIENTRNPMVDVEDVSDKLDKPIARNSSTALSQPLPLDKDLENKLNPNSDCAVIREITLAPTPSVMSTTSTYNTFSLKNILENGSNINFSKNDYDFSETFAESIKSSYKKCQGTLGLSKSDSNFFRLSICADLRLGHVNSLKRTHSLDFRQEKADALGNKKLKSVSLKPENNFKIKTNFIRNHPKLGNSLTNLTPNKCEMGDELTVKQRKLSKSGVSDLESTLVNGQELFSTLKRDILEVQSVAKVQVKDDACKQQKFLKNRLTLPQFLCKNDSISVQYCDSTTNADVIPAIEKCAVETSNKIDDTQTPRKSAEIRKKGIVHKSVPGTATDLQQKVKAVESNSQKTFSSRRDGKSLLTRRTPTKPVRTEKRDAIFDPAKQKLLYRAVKSVVRASPDSKLHIDKLVKSTTKNYAENSKPEKFTEKSQQKSVEKNSSSFSSRPPSQKRKRNLSTSSGNETKSKGLVGLKRKNSRSPTIETQRCSLESILQKEKTDRVLVFDKKLENVFVAKRVADSSDRETKTTVEQSDTPVVVELFSKKPESFDEFSRGRDSEYTNTSSSLRISSQEKIGDSSRSVNGSTVSDVDAQKAIVKSVWALTKVLLYGDGTKKFEILEASLTPPGFSLNNENSNSNKSR